MANEIQYQFNMRLVNVDLTDTYTTSAMRFDQSVARLVRNVQKVGSTEEILNTGNLITPGFAIFANLEEATTPTSTDYIEIGSFDGATFHPFLKLNPGEQVGPVRLGIATTELYAKADTAYTGLVELFYIIYND